MTTDKQGAPYRHRRPSYRITLDGTDITPRINGCLISLTLREQRGLEADQLDITLADHDSALVLPRRGAELVKTRRMLFTLADEALTASGLAMPLITLTRSDGDQHRYAVTDRDSYTGVKAFWQDTDGAQRREVIAGTEDDAKQLRPTYASESDALNAAKAEWRRIQRGTAEFELTLSHDRADVLPESPLRISGYKPEIDATPWLVTEVTHSLNDGGYGTRVKCEISGAEGNQQGSGD